MNRPSNALAACVVGAADCWLVYGVVKAITRADHAGNKTVFWISVALLVTVFAALFLVLLVLIRRVRSASSAAASPTIRSGGQTARGPVQTGL